MNQTQLLLLNLVTKVGIDAAVVTTGNMYSIIEEDEEDHVMLSKINKQAQNLNLTVNRIVRL